MRRSIALVVLAIVVPFPASARSEEPSKLAERAPIGAVVETTLKTAADRIRQYAFDGSDQTFFASEENPKPDDAFTLVFDAPVTLKSIAVKTGKADGSESLESGALLVSTDNATFREIATFTEGTARAEPGATGICAVRIKPAPDLSHPLVIREFAIASEPAVAIFKYPVEFVVDVTDAPEMKDWAEKVARVCERAYPMINEELRIEGDEPPHVVRMALRSNYRGVAAAGGGRITGSVKFFKDHPDDVGAMVHETVHIVQRYRRRNNPSWLVEGVSDYIRFFKFEPGKIGPIDADRAHYNRSYRVTAAFLAYVTDKYDKTIVRKLHKLMRDGEYKDEVFRELTGKSVQELDEEWRATLKRKS